MLLFPQGDKEEVEEEISVSDIATNTLDTLTEMWVTKYHFSPEDVALCVEVFSEKLVKWYEAIVVTVRVRERRASPSDMLVHDPLADIFDAATVALEMINLFWDELDVPPDDREVREVLLSNAITDVCNSTIDREQKPYDLRMEMEKLGNEDGNRSGGGGGEMLDAPTTYNDDEGDEEDDDDEEEETGTIAATTTPSRPATFIQSYPMAPLSKRSLNEWEDEEKSKVCSHLRFSGSDVNDEEE